MFRIAVFTIDLDRYVNAYVHEHSSLCQIGRSGTIPERRQYTCVTRSTFRKTDKLLNVFCEVDILDIVMYLITFSRKYTSLYLIEKQESELCIYLIDCVELEKYFIFYKVRSIYFLCLFRDDQSINWKYTLIQK